MPYTARFVPETQSRADIDASRGPLLLEFGTDWCGHCQAAQPGIEAAFADAGAGVPHLKVEDGRGRALGRSYQVKLWPTLIFLQDGQEVARLVRPTEAAPVRDALRQIAGG